VATNVLLIAFMLSIGVGIQLARRTRQRQWPLWVSGFVGVAVFAVLADDGEEPDTWAPLLAVALLWTIESFVVNRRVPPAPRRGAS
jgi:hypothetical protein